jgi:acyl-coenzyme A thioesterase PaaI-like protein
LRFQPRDPEFEHRVRSTFARQAAMRMLGVTLERVAPGEVDLALPFRADGTMMAVRDRPELAD